MTVTWVLVSYGSVADAKNFVCSLGSLQPVNLVLICNRPGDAEEARDVLSNFDISILDFNDNPGYLPALNRALVLLDTSSPIVLSNCDLLADSDTLQNIERSVTDHADSAIIAPRIVGALGQDQNPYLLTPPTRRELLLLRLLHLHPLLGDVMMWRQGRRGRSPGTTQVDAGSIWAPHGSCVIFTPLYFERGGSVDYPYFLFAEELWVGSEAERIGAKVQYDPTIRLRHIEHASIGRRRRGRVAQAKSEGLAYWYRHAKERGW